jgi:hypothetical protein
LARISTHPDFGTFGVLKWDRYPAPFAVCLENPWKNNERNVSCIPAGDYECATFDSPTHGPTWQVLGVPNRTYILFHKGNTHIHTAGCILVGETFTHIEGIPAIGYSGDGFAEFKSLAPPSFMLRISNGGT